MKPTEKRPNSRERKNIKEVALKELERNEIS